MNIGFMIRTKKGRQVIRPKEGTPLRFRCYIGCTLYGIKQKKNGGKCGSPRCIVTGLTDSEISVVSFDIITGEKVHSATYDLDDVVVFPIPELHSLAESEIKMLKDGTGFPGTVTRDNFCIGERRPEFVKNLGRFEPMVNKSSDSEV